MNFAFVKETPSVFIVCSPFQILCAIEAIHEFKISEYKFILCLIEDIRNQQVFNLMQKFNLQYEIVWLQNLGKKDLIETFGPKKYAFHRAFLGDIDSIWLNLVAIRYLARNSDIVYIDDGTRVIPYLKGQSKITHNKLFYIYSCVRKIKNIRDKGFFFTLFSDVADKKFLCKTNNFNNITKLLSKNGNNKNVYIIGTNINIYCQKLKYGQNDYKNNLENLFKYIKKAYPSDKLFYIQHGRDQNTYVEEFCRKYGFEFIRPKITVELLMVDLPDAPYAIYAYTSTALFTLKKMFPSTLVYNVLCKRTEDSFYDIYLETSKYFEKHGVDIVEQQYIDNNA